MINGIKSVGVHTTFLRFSIGKYKIFIGGYLFLINKRLVNLITYKLPYFGLYKLVALYAHKKTRVIWEKLPFRKLNSPTILPDGNIIICSLEDHNYEGNIYNNSPYERFFKPLKGDIIVDVGAHMGFYTLKAAKQVGKKGYVIAIEPDHNNYVHLNRNIRINKYHNITSINCALADFIGVSRFYLKARSASHSIINRTWSRPNSPLIPIVNFTEVSITTLDELITKLGIQKIDILKINVEGAELKVLKGSEKSLKQRRISQIVLTPHPPVKQESKKIYNYLNLFDYDIVISEDATFLYARLTKRI